MSKKDCTLVITILILIEYVIFNWTYNFGSDKSLTDHVAFAGTIISIILAIVAIIYSFIQTESQNRSSTQIASQITSLRDVVKDFDLSKKEFSSELDRISEIASKLDDVNLHVNESHKVLSTVRSGLDTLNNSLKKNKQEEIIHKEELPTTTKKSPEELMVEHIAFATPSTLRLFYSLKLAAGKNISENDLLIAHHAVPLGKR